MKVKDLMLQLGQLNQDLDVRLHCDHGQVEMLASDVSVRYSMPDEFNEYTLEGSFDSSADYYEEMGEDAEPPCEFVSIYAG